MPFGATSSVGAWYRVGRLIAAIARKVLFLAVWRYSDDQGRSWGAEHYVIPVPKKWIDQHNSWNGSVQVCGCGWVVAVRG